MKFPGREAPTRTFVRRGRTSQVVSRLDMRIGLPPATDNASPVSAWTPPLAKPPAAAGGFDYVVARTVLVAQRTGCRIRLNSADFGGELAHNVTHILDEFGVLGGRLAFQGAKRHRQLIVSITRAPAIPKDLRVSSCAQTPPYWPKDPPITASGLPFRAPSPNGRESQSIAFLRTAG